MLNISQYIKNEKGYDFWDFKNLESLLKVIEIEPEENNDYSSVKQYDNHWIRTEGSYGKKIGKDKDFYHFYDFNTSMNALKYGWDEGLEELTKEVEKVKANLSGKKTLKSEYDVVGGNACVARYLQGIPTNMIKQTMQEKKQKVLNVYKTFPYTGNVKDSTILNEAAKAVIFVNNLEKSGYKVNLYITKVNLELPSNKIKFAVRVKVKDAARPLNLKKIAYCIMNTDMQRRVFWRLIELSPFLKKQLCSYGLGVDNTIKNYGNDMDFSNKTKGKYSKVFKTDDNDIFIPMYVRDLKEFEKSLGR